LSIVVYGQYLRRRLGGTQIPSTKIVPRRTSASTCEPFRSLHFLDADCISLKTIVRHAVLEPLPFVRFVRSRTVTDEQRLEAMTPKLREVYKRQGSWQEMIAGEMRLPIDVPRYIQALEARNKQRAENSGVEPSAEDLARMSVDQNFDIG
jgi:hypothetical protein